MHHRFKEGGTWVLRIVGEDRTVPTLLETRRDALGRAKLGTDVAFVEEATGRRCGGLRLHSGRTGPRCREPAPTRGTSGKQDQGSELPRCGEPQDFSVRADCSAEGEAEKNARGRGTPSRTLCSATVVGEQREEEWRHQSSFCCTLLAARSSVLQGGERARGARQGSGCLSVAAVSAGKFPSSFPIL